MEQTQDRVDMILHILRTHFPIECEMAGASNLVNIANGVSREIRPIGGPYYDISLPLSVLSACVGFTSSVINICIALKKEKMPTPMPVTVINVIKNDDTNNNTISNDIKLNITREIIDQIFLDSANGHTGNDQ